MKFQISSRAESRKRYTLVIKNRVISKQFCFIRCRNNTSGRLNRGGIANLPFLRTLLAILQKLLEASFWKVIDYFDLLAYLSYISSAMKRAIPL